jgi:hypothetical protein
VAQTDDHTCVEEASTVIDQLAAEKLASIMLAEHGIAFVWDAYVAAAAAYGLGAPDVARDLVEIAEAAENEWLQPALRSYPPHSA